MVGRDEGGSDVVFTVNVGGWETLIRSVEIAPKYYFGSYILSEVDFCTKLLL